ncbi:MAG: peptidylprolyl isomerase [Coleofasciculaceae cyanobacterium]
MDAVLQVGDRLITATEIIPLLASYQLLPSLLREVIIDQAIASYHCTPEEKATALEQFAAKNQLTDAEAKHNWLKYYHLSEAQLEALATRGILIEKFKQATWNHKLESYFLSRKGQLDRVIYSLIRTQDPGIAQEIYFRIQENEQSFADLARQYSQGSEAQTGGMIGPVEISVPHPTLSQLLRLSQPGQLLPPTRLEDWFIIIRLEKFIPAQLDEVMRQRLLNECFTNWLSEQLKQQLIGGA